MENEELHTRRCVPFSKCLQGFPTQILIHQFNIFIQLLVHFHNSQHIRKYTVKKVSKSICGLLRKKCEALHNEPQNSLDFTVIDHVFHCEFSKITSFLLLSSCGCRDRNCLDCFKKMIFKREKSRRWKFTFFTIVITSTFIISTTCKQRILT
jgi:hypothetical protein